MPRDLEQYGAMPEDYFSLDLQRNLAALRREQSRPYITHESLMMKPDPHSFEAETASVIQGRLRARWDELDRNERLVASALGVDPATVPMFRHVPLDIYIDAEDSGLMFQLAVPLGMYLEEWGLHQSSTPALEQGSIRYRPVFRTSARFTEQELRDHINLATAVLADALARQSAADAPPSEIQTQKELDKLDAEIRQAKAETIKTHSETANNVAKLILSIAAGVSMLIGASRITISPPADGESGHRVVHSESLTGPDAFRYWTEDKHSDDMFRIPAAPAHRPDTTDDL